MTISRRAFLEASAAASPVMIEVAGSQFHAAADAVTILEQIEGALVFLDTVPGQRTEFTGECGSS